MREKQADLIIIILIAVMVAAGFGLAFLRGKQVDSDHANHNHVQSEHVHPRSTEHSGHAH